MSGSSATIWEGPTVSIPTVNSNGNTYEEVQVATAAQTVFTLATFTYTPNTKSIFVFRKNDAGGGEMLRRGVDYTETSASVITLAVGATVGDLLFFVAYAISSVNPPVTLNGLPAGGTTGQILAKTSGSDYATAWTTLTALATLLDSARQNVASASTVDLTGAVSTQTRNIQITGSVQIDGFQITNGQLWAVKFASALTLKNNASIVTESGADISVQPNDTCFLRATAANVVEILCFTRGALAITPRSTVRQTVQSGPVTAAGLPNPGGATGATSVTTTGIAAATPWVVNAANGVSGDRLGISTANLVYTGLSTNGTMYLFNDVAADGTITTATSTVAPVYQEGGAGSITNGALVFNISTMSGLLGNGAASVLSYRVCVGEVTVAGGVVSAITWYAYNGRYDSGYTVTLPGITTQLIRAHNLGLTPDFFDYIIESTVLDAGYAVGSKLKGASLYTVDASGRVNLPIGASRTNVILGSTGSAGGILTVNATTSQGTGLTAASWKYKFIANRGW